ncbi:glycosyltransferase [Providencia rettgeri]|uniref:glycosyltransferase n=1 Tax=Providencia rettgeri TaxID=587 RepID=UPI00244A465D|nr:glycosyltransferase [Providencia rettgeri]MDH2370401.1 glycosyltransferase [Providencia rettgeri]
MSTLLFVHDHLFTKDSNNIIYSSGGFPSNLWSKYLDHVAKIEVIARTNGYDEKASEKYILSSHDRVEFHFVESISNPIKLIKNRSKVYSVIFDKVKTSDYIIARLPSENGLIAASIALKLDKPLCIEVVGCAWGALTTHGSLLGKLYAPISYLRTRRIIKKTDFVLYVTSSFLQSRYPANKAARTVCASNVSIHTDSNFSKEKKKTSKQKYIFGLIGNYKAKYKGLDVAIKALAAVHWENRQFELRILGKGDSSTYINLAKELGIENCIYFYNPLPSGKPVLDWLDEIDIYIQPSLIEGLPRSLIEAMSRGCISLGSDAGGIPELLEPQFLHKAGNVVSFKDSIENLIKNENDFEYYSNKNIQRAREYDHKLINDRRFDFFDAFIRSKNENN